MLFHNITKSGSFQKNNCATGGTGSWVTYTVNSGAYTSTISQADADAKAQNDINVNGQTYANNNGYCTFYNVIQSGSFQKNNCTIGGTGSWVTYTVNAGKYASTISQADADAQAQNEINANGQTYANNNGYCTFYNNPVGEYIQKNDCNSGAVGSWVYYSVAAATYISYTSQSDADNMAWNDVYSNGQSNANANGYCTYYNTQQSGSFTKNDCGSGYNGSSVNYVVPANTYSSTISQAYANVLAQNDINSNGQAYANANGTCTLGCNCYDVSQKCINISCETGTKVYTNSTYNFNGTYTCTYHYEWSDGSWSQDYTETSYSNCGQGAALNSYQMPAQNESLIDKRHLNDLAIAKPKNRLISLQDTNGFLWITSENKYALK